MARSDDAPRFSSGTACNFAGKSARGEFTLHGDKKKKAEKPHTIVHFPGGSVEITRTPDGDYWAHIALDRAEDGMMPGRVVDARIDLRNGAGYVPPEVDAALRGADFEHVALCIRRGGKSC